MPSVTQLPPLLSPISTDELGQLQLHLPTLKVLSYRGPGESGGVPTSLEPIVKRLGTKIHWFALSGVPKEQESPLSGFAFYNPQIPQTLIERHHKISSGYLWPLMHGMPECAVFDAENWKAYRQLNEMLASECLAVSSQSFPTLCWLHDYQLALVAPLMSMQAGVLLCQFWHIPWPQASVMVQSAVGKELVESLLCNKVIGFHTTEYATNFLNTVSELMPNAAVDMLKMEVRRRRQVTKIVVMPLGVDFGLWQRLARQTRPIAEAISVKYRLANQIILGVDRLDYTKGVLEKLNGIEKFLDTSPVWKRRIHYVQLAQPPQSSEPAFAQYAAAVEKRIEEINRKYASDGWQPIIYLPGQYDQSELAAWYQAADVLAINSVRDGLNLIAKEYVASRLDEQGTLVLSKNAGCAAELAQGAILVNPHDCEDFANALKQALTLEVEEKRRRMTSMRRVVGWNQLHDWALGFLRQAINGKAAYTPLNTNS
ncbi:MAG TPA: trehalose-6-phosphate synthase [Planktothrix sp.]|jgi:trehalose 6-phosphate synthase